MNTILSDYLMLISLADCFKFFSLSLTDVSLINKKLNYYEPKTELDR